MEISTILILVAIGFFAGMMSGFIGIGGGVVMVPALIYLVGLTQREAMGLSITTMLPPIGIMAFYSYYQAGVVTKELTLYGAVMAVTFVVGAFLGSKIALRISPNLIKLIFGGFMIFVAIKMIISGMSYFTENHD